jgi:hypothetical protein
MTHDISTDQNSDEIADASTSLYPALTIDWNLYAQHLKNSDLTDDEKREFIQTLWDIVVSFVDLGFGVHPVQDDPEDNLDENIALQMLDVIDFDHSDNNTKTAMIATDDPQSSATERKES